MTEKKACDETCVDGLIPRIDPQTTPLGCFVLINGTEDLFNGLATLNKIKPSLNILDPYTDKNLMDPGYCIKHCVDYKFTYAGLMGGVNCRCGNYDVFTSYSKTTDNYCSYNCTFVTSSGSVTYPCGGNEAITIYQAISPNYEIPKISIQDKLDIMDNLNNLKNDGYKGCIKDSQNCGQRALSGKCGPVNDVSECIDFCRGGNFKYAGLEAGIQCFCDNTFDSIGLTIGIEHCSSSCRGNFSQICGGSWALSVYEISTQSSNSDNKDLKIGLGVGIPAFLILIGFCIFFTLRRC